MLRDRKERFKRALLAERARLRGLNPEERDAIAAPVTMAIEDRASVLHDQEVVLRSHEIDLAKHRLVEQALRRLERESYGICLECQEAIPERRLEAIPWAAYCVRCQERMDEAMEEEVA